MSPSLPRPPSLKALLIGINYRTSDSMVWRPLNGPVNEAQEFKKLLIDCYKFKQEDITTLIDAESVDPKTSLWPTRDNIASDHSFLHSIPSRGHSRLLLRRTRVQTDAVNDKNEWDGRDEYIIPCDAVSDDSRVILDDELQISLVKPLPEGCRLTAILDACHSGTLLDLEHYECNRAQIIRSSASLPILRQNSPAKFGRPKARRRTISAMTTIMWRKLNVKTKTRSIIRFLSSAKHSKPSPDRGHRTPQTLLTDSPQAARSESAWSSSSTLPLFSPARPPRSPRSRVPCSGFCRFSPNAKGPIVISLSSCADHQQTWEDDQKGESMTTGLIEILNPNTEKSPSITVRDLGREMQKYFFDQAVARKQMKVWELERKRKKEKKKKRRELPNDISEPKDIEIELQAFQFGSKTRLTGSEIFLPDLKSTA
ncbi:hypothetical protein EW146_g8806 [Bondarzewia mesenterica]|uniref:Peptidase C14 caspase domain-containing protein n=1 Tax=Bondarzewia mesenterica TaxID=1095465 RepID=A0A4S4LBK3_9AGAM|nr:hypothetical protein EW146_g8806 [Bondarzewia mesenterica]